MSTADPMAELARLSRPSGPWLHLLDGAPADARQLGWMLGQHGVIVRILRGHCLRTGYGLFDEAAAALQLPGDPVEDWPALAALLTDMSWLPGEGHLLVVTRAGLLLAAAPLTELSGFVGAVRDIARGRAEEGDPVPFHVVLQDDAVGLATLRPRLDAAGARYDALAGWDAEEPAAEATLGRRTGYQPGDPRLDEVDRAVGTALSTWDGLVELRRSLVELRRSYEVFGGLSGAPVRVYAPVFRAASAGTEEIAAAVSAIAAAAGAACLVLPLPVDDGPRDPRQQAVADSSVVVWPEPEPMPSTEPSSIVDATRPVQPTPADAADRRSPATPVEPAAHPSTVDADSTVSVEPDEPQPVAAAAEQPLVPTEVTEADGPRDDPAGAFELVAANLEWPFDSGSTALDAVDAALVRYAGGSGRMVALFRTWVGDPAGGWVRVVMAYVGSGSISDVETERSTIVDLAQRSGAKRCCIEIVGVSDVGDVHRWIEDRSVSLWRANSPARRDRAADSAESPDQPAPASAASSAAAAAADVPSPRVAPTGPAAGSAAGADSPAAAPASPAEATPPAHSAPPDPPAHSAPPAGSATGAEPGAHQPSPATAGAASDGVTTAGPPEAATAAGPGQPAPSGAATATVTGGAVAQPVGAGVTLPPDATFQPGPGDDGEASAALVAWAVEREGVLGVVTAWTEIDARPTVLVGVVVDADADQSTVRAEAAAVVGEVSVPHLVESFAPSRGMAPQQLRLYRGSTRLWTRKVERAPSGPQQFQLDTSYQGMNSTVDKVVDVGPPPTNELLDNGLTLVTLDLDESVQRGSDQPDERDAAVVAWVAAQPQVLAALRAESTQDDTVFPVYTVLVDADADRAGIRRGVGDVVAGTGADRCAVEVFCPFETITVFNVHLYGASLSLWKTDQARPAADATAEQSTSDGGN